MSVSDADPDKPLFEWFIEKYHSSSRNTTIESANQSRKWFNHFLNKKGIEATDVDRELAKEFLNMLVDEDRVGAHYQSNIASDVSNFYAFCNQRNVNDIDGNPIDIVLDENDILEEPKKSETHIIDENEMSDYLYSFDVPVDFAITTCLAKTTRRIGAILNLDLYDVNIDHPACDWNVHEDVRFWPDHFYVPPEPEAGEKFRGMKRSRSNKTKSSRVVPIDDELKAVILYYLTTREGELSNNPSANKHHPLWKNNRGKRVSYQTYKKMIRQKSKSLGHYYEPHDPHNITAHYFRHWCTTKIRDRSTGDTGLVDYLRGDVGQDMKDHYTHWSEAKEQEYREIVPKFF